MKKVCFLAVAGALGICASVRADEGPSIPRGSLRSGANLGQFLGGPGVSGGIGNSPFTNGLGQIVSGWTQQGIHGQDLAERVHWLRGMQADEIAERTRWLERRRFAYGDRFRDIRQDLGELRDDERRLARDRLDMRDLHDRDDRFRNRDSREDQGELRKDERRLARDRQDMRRDLRDRDERFRDRDRDDHVRDPDRDRDDRNWDDRDRDRDRNRDDRPRDRDEHAMRDHDPRRDRDDRRRRRNDFANKGQDDHRSSDRGQDHNVAKKDDFGKHMGAYGGRNSKSDQRSNVPAAPVSAASWAEAMFEQLSKDFGSVPRGPTLSHAFRLTNNTGGPVHIARVRVSCGCVSASAVKEDLAPGESTAIQAQIDTRRFRGVKKVTIFVLFDQPSWEEVSLSVRADGRDDLRLNPDE